MPRKIRRDFEEEIAIVLEVLKMLVPEHGDITVAQLVDLIEKRMRETGMST
jgi:hypothetical protein